MKKPLKIPFGPKGMLNYAWPGDDRVMWVDNYEFTDALRFKYMFRRRSGASAVFVSDSDGKEYYASIGVLLDLIPLLERGVIRGTFTFFKHGANYNIKLVENKNPGAQATGAA